MQFPVERRKRAPGSDPVFHQPHETPLLCVDAGSRYCPCSLASLGECIECSIMRGETVCSCRWPGACILAHSDWQGANAGMRQSVRVPIIDSTTLEDGSTIVTVRVSPLLAAEVMSPGSFVFARGNENPHFDAPFAVAHASPEKKELTFVYKTLGPKTRSLLANKDSLWLRGPYWNGIAGRHFIDAAENKKCLLIGGGVSVAVLPNVVRSLLRRNNTVMLVQALPVAIEISGFLPLEEMEIVTMVFPEERPRLHSLMKDFAPDLVFGGGGRLLQLMVSEFAGDLPVAPDMVFTQDQNMCCGEGICGACLEMVDGRLIRICKTMR